MEVVRDILKGCRDLRVLIKWDSNYIHMLETGNMNCGLKFLPFQPHNHKKLIK